MDFPFLSIVLLLSFKILIVSGLDGTIFYFFSLEASNTGFLPNRAHSSLREPGEGVAFVNSRALLVAEK